MAFPFYAAPGLLRWTHFRRAKGWTGSYRIRPERRFVYVYVQYCTVLWKNLVRSTSKPRSRGGAVQVYVKGLYSDWPSSLQPPTWLAGRSLSGSRAEQLPGHAPLVLFEIGDVPVGPP